MEKGSVAFSSNQVGSRTYWQSDVSTNFFKTWNSIPVSSKLHKYYTVKFLKKKQPISHVFAYHNFQCCKKFSEIKLGYIIRIPQNQKFVAAINFVISSEQILRVALVMLILIWSMFWCKSIIDY